MWVLGIESSSSPRAIILLTAEHLPSPLMAVGVCKAENVRAVHRDAVLTKSEKMTGLVDKGLGR